MEQNDRAQSAEEIVRALLNCIDTTSCDKCGLFGPCNGTFSSLTHIAADKITELNDFTSSQCAKLLERVMDLEAQLTASQQEKRAAVRNEELARERVCQQCREVGVQCNCSECEYGPQEAEKGAAQ